VLILGIPGDGESPAVPPIRDSLCPTLDFRTANEWVGQAIRALLAGKEMLVVQPERSALATV